MGKASRKKEQQIQGISSAPISASTHQSFLVKPLPAVLIVLLLSFIVNFNVLSNGFGWDDDITINKSLRSPDYWWNLFLQNSTTDTASKSGSSYYRPMVSVSYLIDFMIWGRNPFGFHLSVLLAHLLNTTLVFLLAQALIKDKTIPFSFLPILTATLFAVHPAHAEAVAWIAGRNDVFCTTFILSSILLYIRFRRTGKEWAFGLSMLFFFFALLTKEMAVGLVFLYPLFDHLFVPPAPIHARSNLRIRLLIPVAILGLYFWMRTRNITYPLGSTSSADASSPFLAVLGATGLYFKLMIFPFPHNPFITTLPKSPFAFILSGLGLVFLVGGVVWSILRRHGLIGWGLAWTVVLLAPAIPLAFLIVAATPAAERYVYAPSIGFLMALGVLILNGLDRLRVRTGWTTRTVWVSAGFLLAVLVIALGWISWNRNTVWRSPLTFWEAAAAVSTGDEPRGAMAHNNLGHLYRRQKRLDKAMQEFQAALNLKPDYAMAYYNLGLVYKDLQRLENAVEAFQAALNLKPNYLEAHSDLAKTYKDLGRLEEAIREYQIILQLKPDSVESHVDLGMAYRKQGRLEEAIQEYQTALRLKPDSVEAHVNLGVIYDNQGRPKDAVKEYQTALIEKPELVEAHYNLGAVYNDLGRIEEAIREFQTTIQLQPDLAEAHYSLGDAYRLKGQINEAHAAFNRALQIKPDFAAARKALEFLPR